MTGGSGSSNYQWQFNNSGTWEDINLATSSVYTTALLNSGVYQYRVEVIQDAGCQKMSDPFSITVLVDPVITVAADDLVICSGGSINLTSTLTGEQVRNHTNGNMITVVGKTSQVLHLVHIVL